MFSQPKTVAFVSESLSCLSIVPGLPPITFHDSCTFWCVVLNTQEIEQKILIEEEKEKEVLKKSGKNRNPEESVEKLLHVDRMGIEVGYRLVPLVDPQKTGVSWKESMRCGSKWQEIWGLWYPRFG